MTGETAAPVEARHAWRFWLFVIVMLVLTGLFLGLGKWQLDRLAWKQGLIAAVERNMRLPPVPFPAAAQWPTLDAEAWQYRPVTVTGRFLNAEAVRVFVGLGEARGRYSGTGYWIMVPFALEAGGSVFVDRGFVPDARAADYVDDRTAPQGLVTLSGVVVASETAGMFTPAPDRAKRIEWVRDVARLAAMAPDAPRPVAPVYIDLPAGPPGALPQGGETTVDFPNSHLGYAMTWFGFALTTLIMLAEWIRRQRQGAPRAR